GFIKVNCSSTATVKISVLILVSIYDQVLKNHIFSFQGAEDGENVADASVLLLGVVISQRHWVDAQDATLDSRDGRDAHIPPAVQSIVQNGKTHPGPEFSRFGHGQLAFSIIAVLAERAFHTRTFPQDGLAWHSTHRHTRGDKKTVVHLIGASTNFQDVSCLQ